MKHHGSANLTREGIIQGDQLKEPLPDSAFDGLRQRDDLHFIDLRTPMCMGSECPVFIQDKPYTYDVHHFTVEFERLLDHHNQSTLTHFLNQTH